MPRLPSDDAAVDPLASWNEGAVKTSILDFVARVTEPDGKDYVPPERRIATFDNDGTLWVEQPYPSQIAFALDLAKAKPRNIPDGKKKSLSNRCWPATSRRSSPAVYRRSPRLSSPRIQA